MVRQFYAEGWRVGMPKRWEKILPTLRTSNQDDNLELKQKLPKILTK